LIGYLFKYFFFSFSLITNILEEYVKKTKKINDDDVEKLLVLWSIINNNIKEYDINYYDK